MFRARASGRETAQGRSPAPGRASWARAGVLLLLLASLAVGPWAQFAPLSFWEGFPGLGHAWVSTDGPYNEHLVRDVGGLQLGMVVLLLAALVRPETTLVRVAALASIAWQAPHVVYHLLHVEDLPTVADRAAQSFVLVLTLAVAFALLALTSRRGAAADGA